ncbi:MAG: DUF6058 family natural product biosynthesis protein [Pseudomonadota bacterium]
MKNVSAQQVQKYLADENYLTEKELADKTGTTAENILNMEELQCIPAATYVVTGQMIVTSSFGEYQLPIESERYYHPSVVSWVSEALEFADKYDLGEVAKMVRENFDNRFSAALDGESPPWPDGADYAWNYITDGTWGLCLKSVDMDHILTKEYARAAIRELMVPETSENLTSEERNRLIESIKSYRKVALPFAPHEFPESSTEREVNPAIRKYKLTAEELST